MSKPRKQKGVSHDAPEQTPLMPSPEMAVLEETIAKLRADVKRMEGEIEEFDQEVRRLREEIKTFEDQKDSAIDESDHEAVAIAMWNEVALGENFHAQSYEVKEKHYAMAKTAITFRYP